MVMKAFILFKSQVGVITRWVPVMTSQGQGSGRLVAMPLLIINMGSVSFYLLSLFSLFLPLFLLPFFFFVTITIAESN